MTSRRIARTLFVDANCILSAVIGGQAMRVITAPAADRFAVTQMALAEVAEYLPVLAVKKGLTLPRLQAALALLPLTVYEPPAYAQHMAAAQRLIQQRDPDDVDTLALAFALDAPIWSNDRDFEEATEWRTFTTARLLGMLDRPD